MPEREITTRPGDNLLAIARDNGFRNIEAIVRANPGLAERNGTGNFNVLRAGLKIKIPALRIGTATVPTGTTTTFVADRKTRDILLNIVKPGGDPATGWQYQLNFTGGPSFTGTTDATGKITARDVPVTARTGTLTFPGKHFAAQVENESIGFSIGFEPVNDSHSGKRSIQMILKNSGYYDGEIDGNLDTDASRAAIRSFQVVEGLNAYGYCDKETLERLIERYADYYPEWNSVSVEQLKDDTGKPTYKNILDFSGVSVPGFLVTAAKIITLSFVTDDKYEFTGPSSRYLDPTDPEQSHRKREEGRLDVNHRVYPSSVYIALSDQTYRTTYTIRPSTRKFMFLDTGAWLGSDHRQFSVIWGWNVYLCQYRDDGRATKYKKGEQEPNRLDSEFFFHDKINGYVEVLEAKMAYWAPESDFDWNTLYITIPDTHLLPHHILKHWRPGCTLYDAEFELLAFAKKLSQLGGLKQRIKMVHMGDLYDLWVGRHLCLFSDNDNGTMQLVSTNGAAPEGLLDSIRNELARTNSVLKDIGFHNPFALDGDSVRLDAGKILSNWINEIKGVYPASEERIEKPLRPQDQNYYFDNWVLKVVKDRCGNNTERLNRYYDDLRSEVMRDAIGTYYYLVNPAVKAVELLEREFEMVYIYGNHDNYLGINEVCNMTGLRPRVRYYTNSTKPKSVFIEHGHRMEAFFAFEWLNKQFGLNNDGCRTGYDATISQYMQQLSEEDKNILVKFLELLPPYIGGKKLITQDSNISWWETLPIYALGKRLKAECGLTAADWWGQWHDQKEYYGEYAQVWLGRYFKGDTQKPPPHLFVIGHTHRAMLREIDIVFTASEEELPRRRRPRRVS